MTHGSLFVAPVPGTPPVGMSATDARLVMGGIFGTTAQLVAGGGISQSGSNMQFTVAQSVWEIADVTNAAAAFFAATDSTVLTPAAGPGTGSRKDLICVRAHNYEDGDADSQAAAVLVAGTDGSPGVDPAAPAGYYKYAEITAGAGVTTAAACTVIIYGSTTFAPPELKAPTLALLNLTVGQAAQYATVTADATPANNGLYLWSGTGWVAVSGPVQGVLALTSTFSATSGYTTKLEKNGDIVTLAFAITNSATTATGVINTGVAIATLPTGFRPSTNPVTPFVGFNNSGAVIIVYTIDTAGVIRAYPASSLGGGATLYGSVSFSVA